MSTISTVDYEAVAIPPVTAGRHGEPTWPLATDTRVYIHADGTIATAGAPNRFDSPEQAEALGRALIAAARFQRDVNRA